MDFKNLDGVWKLKKFCITCIEFIFKFLPSQFCFQLEILFDLDFQMYKPTEKLWFRDFVNVGYSSTFDLFDGKV